MNSFLKRLKDPFVGLDNNNVDGVQHKCAELAKELFNNYYIKCKDKKYYLAEIEIYYFKEGCLNDKWNEVTYPRMGYRAGSLFYHLSGMDICFESNLEKKKGVLYGKGGGILIRSIADEYGNIVVGPLTCVNVMLNSCKGRKMPQLKRLSTSRNITPKETYRYLGDNDWKIIGNGNKDGKLRLAYFDRTTISEESWNNARSSYYSKRLDCPTYHE